MPLPVAASASLLFLLFLLRRRRQGNPAPLEALTFSIYSPLSTSASPGSSADGDSSPPPPAASVRQAARPYAMVARLDKPIGTWLLAWPCFWYYGY
uniref:Uncharacterized protein n=1 Tax=Leersia perrieri TaxID=77586 RepID=A0A0D9W127_9ORYZ